MRIQWHGKTQFTINGKNATICIDGPTTVNADMFFYSSQEEGRKEPETAKIFDWPGEYEVRGVSISCFPGEGDKENLIYYFEVDRLKVCHLGKFQGKLTEDMTKEISETDVLIIPVNETESLTAKQAHEIIEEIEPRIVIPTNYEAADLDKFIKEMSIENPEPQEKFEIKSRTELPENRTEYVILKQQ